MATRAIGAALVVAIAGIAAYDAKFTLPSIRSNSTQQSNAIMHTYVSAAQIPVEHAEHAASQEETAEMPEQATTEQTLEPSARFAGAWPNPFAEETTVPQAGEPEAETTPVLKFLPEPFEGYRPDVRAVLIAGEQRRAIIDRLILSEGETVPGLNAIVHKVMPQGVELEKSGIVKFFPVSK